MNGTPVIAEKRLFVVAEVARVEDVLAQVIDTSAGKRPRARGEPHLVIAKDHN